MGDSEPLEPAQHNGTSQHVSHTAQIGWDRTTYRITRINEAFDMPRLSQAIQSLFQLKDNQFKIHSLAYDASDETEPPWKVATISFRTRPTHMQNSLDDQSQWGFEIRSSLTDPTECSRIFFDTHFNGFTPLSPAESGRKYTIECGST